MTALTCTVKQACQITGASKEKLYKLIFSGELKAKKVGQKIYINMKSLNQLFGGN